MSQRERKPPVTHSTFVIEREYPVRPARVFAAWSDPVFKLRWTVCGEGWVVSEHQFDFRVGGRELLRLGPAGGTAHVFDGHYFDIVPDERIVYGYALQLGDVRISVSLATLELRAVGRGTKLVFTEQGAYLDGYDGAREREEGTREGLDRLAPLLADFGDPIGVA